MLDPFFSITSDSVVEIFVIMVVNSWVNSFCVSFFPGIKNGSVKQNIEFIIPLCFGFLLLLLLDFDFNLVFGI